MPYFDFLDKINNYIILQTFLFYKTLSISFMESVWNVFKQMYDKGLVYRGCKIMAYSNTCTTVLSNFEAN